mmetsp:Transcript_25975/g.72730  ORF Transcript_25975/g.72730 Transcript_25975/m.72730 type:complete len:209 (+) Transcript_25975:1999-2625(+)
MSGVQCAVQRAVGLLLGRDQRRIDHSLEGVKLLCARQPGSGRKWLLAAESRGVALLNEGVAIPEAQVQQCLCLLQLGQCDLHGRLDMGRELLRIRGAQQSGEGFLHSLAEASKSVLNVDGLPGDLSGELPRGLQLLRNVAASGLLAQLVKEAHVGRHREREAEGGLNTAGLPAPGVHHRESLGLRKRASMRGSQPAGAGPRPRLLRIA